MQPLNIYCHVVPCYGVSNNNEGSTPNTVVLGTYEEQQGRTSLADIGETTSLDLHPSRLKCINNTDPFAEDTVEAGDELVDVISEERRQTLIETTDMTHGSKKAWVTIRKVCNHPRKARRHYNTIANQVAHHLLLNKQTAQSTP